MGGITLENKRYSPQIDKLVWWITAPTVALLVAVTVLSAFAPMSLFVMLPMDLFTLYFLVSPLFGYVELRGETVFVKFGLFMKREIPYSKIRGAEKVRKFYSDSILSLKNSFEHVNIRYNSFDMLSVSVVGNDELISDIEARRLE